MRFAIDKRALGSIPRAILWPFLATTLLACASPGPQRSSAAPATGDADQLAASALRAWAVDRNASQALTLIKRATERQAGRADLAWLHVRLCMEAPGCEPEPLEARLRQLDPENGVVWLGALSRAQALRDTQTEQQILKAMSGATLMAMSDATRFDLYWTTLVSRLLASVSPNTSADAANAQKDPLTSALNDVTSWLSSLATPSFKPLTSACDKQGMRDEATATYCERIAQAMQRSDTTLVEGLGLGIGQRLATPGTPAAAALDRRIATLSHQSQTAGSIVQAQVERDKFSAEIVELMKKLRREQDVSAAILRWAGQPLDPPPASARTTRP